MLAEAGDGVLRVQPPGLPDHLIQRPVIDVAWGPNKKMAEQKAALLALEDLGVFAAREVEQAIDEIHASEVVE